MYKKPFLEKTKTFYLFRTNKKEKLHTKVQKNHTFFDTLNSFK